MTQWTDKHYDLNYTLTDKDIEEGKIRVDAYFVAKVWKTGSKDDSGALWHCLKTIARFGDKNDVEREVKALYAQVLGVARSFGVELEPAINTKEGSDWVVIDGSSVPSLRGSECVEIKTHNGRRYRGQSWMFDWREVQAYKIVE